MGVAGVVAGASVTTWVARAGWGVALGAGMITLLLWGALASPLALKRGIAAGIAAAIERSAPGQAVLRELFDRMLAVDDASVMGQRGGGAVRTVENLPLRDAEQALKRAVGELLDVPLEGEGTRGGLRRRMRDALVERIEALTLTGLREADTGGAGVDLMKVRNQVGAGLDARLAVGALEAAAHFTRLIVIGALIGSVAIALLIERAA